MADQLYLSYWLRNHSEPNMLRHYEKMLKLFPFSRLARQPSTFKIIALNYGETPIVEIPYAPLFTPADALAVARDFQNGDACYRLEGWWDLWRFETQWELGPTRAALCCFGPEFERENGEHLLIEFGIEEHFLPQPHMPDSPRMIRSNIQSLLKLVHDLDDGLPVETRRLWSEAGENFSEKLQQALAGVGE